MDHIDDVISAELPDPTDSKTKPLFDIVSKHLIHGPCGDLNPQCVCMENNKCTKSFPKQFLNETNANTDGYPLYRRRDNGIFFNKIINNKTIKVC
jgi:hypothetical protein